MPEYVYLCPEGHEMGLAVRMLYSTGVLCPDCGNEMKRKPAMPAVNWGGLKPSQGELHPNIKRHIENVPRNRERILAEQEAKTNG